MSFSLTLPVAVGAILLLTASCKKEQPEITNQLSGCGCAQEVSADFKIIEIASYNQTNEMRTETDTAFNSRNIRFEAIEKNADYTWYIGSEILSDSVVTRYFSASFAGQNIPITLVVKKKPNSICFPADDGYDSITKMVYIHPWNGFLLDVPPAPTAMEGTYRMSNESDPDSIDLIIDYFYDHSQSYGVRIINVHEEMDTVKSNGFLHNFRELRTTSIYVGNFRNKLNGEAEFIFEDRTVSPYVQYHFKGRKL